MSCSSQRAVTPPIGICKEMVSTDGIVVGTMCGHFPDDEPWLVGMTAEVYDRQLDEALEREDEKPTKDEPWRS